MATFIVRRVVGIYKDFEVEASSAEHANSIAPDWFAEGAEYDGETNDTRSEIYDDDANMLEVFE